MGYMLHHAIVVTSWDVDAIERAAIRARNLGLTVIGPSAPLVNDYRTMTVCPDGSKEGWDESKDGDGRRQIFREWLNSQRHEDGSSSLEWFEAAYGSDDRTAQVLFDAWRAG